MQRDEYEIELAGDRTELAAVFAGVANGLRAGSLRMGGGTDALAVDVPEELTLEMEFEVEDDERSLELELEWEVEDGADDIAPAAVEEPGDEVDDDSPNASSTDTADTTVSEDREIATEADSGGAVEAAETPPVGAVDAPAPVGRFELYRDRADEWRWRLRHRNGNVIATSGQGYTRKANARKGLRSVMLNAPGAAVEED